MAKQRSRSMAGAPAPPADMQPGLPGAVGTLGGFWSWDLEADRIRGDTAFARLLDLDPLRAAEGVPMEALLRAVHPRDRVRMRRAIRETLQDRGGLQQEIRLLRRDGRPAWALASGHCLADPDGRVRQLPGILMDITARRLAEEDLRAQSLRQHRAVAAAGLGIWDFDLVDGSQEWDARSKALFGLPPTARLDYRRFLALLHPDDRVRVGEAMQRVLDPEARAEFDLEYRIRRADDGAERVLSARGRVQFADRQPLRFTGTLLDVTERRALERAMRESEQRFRAMAESIPQLAWITDRHGWIFWYNQRWFDFTGTSLEEMQGWGWRKVHHPDHVERVTARIRECFASGEPWEDTFPLRGRDGRYRWFLSRALPLRDEAGEIVNWFGTNTDITEQLTAETALRRLNARLEAEVAERTRERDRLWVVSQELMAVVQVDGRLKSVNPAWQRLLGYEEAMLLSRSLFDLTHRDDAARLQGWLDRLRSGATVQRFDLRLRAADGSHRWIAWTAVPEGERFYAQGRDDTEMRAAAEKLEAANRELVEEMQERERVEGQLRQAQKMESLGHLTGGVAHDFNNLLTVVLGNLEALGRAPAVAGDDRAARAVANALQGARRAATLTSSLLAFSRRQPLNPEPTDANALVREMTDLLRRTIGEQVEIRTVLTEGLWPSLADRNQLENAILNLALNARDAMPDGGRLTIETSNTELDEGWASTHPDVAPGEYVMIAVTDTGSGMTQEIAAQAFDPFFTTKEVGIGTGLGLSQVYGFVKQSDGHVQIYSEIGNGTSIKVFLPRFSGDRPPGNPRGPAAATDSAPPRGSAGERILLVEDDPDVRAFAGDALRELGYAVLQAGDGPAGLMLLDRHHDIRLLFTDVGLPGGMNGRQLADEAVRRRPGLAVLFATAYARNAIIETGRLEAGVNLLTKPYTVQALGEKVRAMFDKSGRDPAGATGTADPPRILIVEDEVLVRMVAVDELLDQGCAVEEAGSAEEALAILRKPGRAIAAVVVDVGLPDRKGDALAGEIRGQFPDLPILVASGYDLRDLALPKDDSRLGMIPKPYSPEGLVQALRKLQVPLGS